MFLMSHVAVELSVDAVAAVRGRVIFFVCGIKVTIILLLPSGCRHFGRVDGALFGRGQISFGIDKPKGCAEIGLTVEQENDNNNNEQ